MKNGLLVLAITTGVQALVSIAVLTLPVMAPALGQVLGISATYTGLYVAIVYLGATLTSLAGGPAINRFGAIRVSQVGLLLCAAGLVLCSLPAVPAIAAGGFLIGLGYGPITPASSHLLMRTTPAHRMSLVFSIKQTGVPLGGVLAGAIVPGLVLWVGWQAALWTVAAANLIGIVMAQPMRPFDADRDPRQPLVLGNLAGSVRLVLSHPTLRLLAACSFVFSIAQLSLSAFMVTYLDAVLAYGLVAAGLALSFAQLGGAAGRVLWGWLADRWFGARRMLAALAVLMSLASLGTALLHPGLPLPLVVGVLLVFGASAVGWNGVFLAEVARQAPAGQAGLVTGGTLAVTFFGIVLGPPLFGAISALFTSYRAGFAALAMATGVCAFALLRARTLGPTGSGKVA